MGLYKWEVLGVFRHSDKFGKHRNFENGDLMFLFCHGTSSNHIGIIGSITM